jgi:hypothetical protein
VIACPSEHFANFDWTNSEHNSITALISAPSDRIIYTEVHFGESAMDNRTVARQLLKMAHSLERECANLYRVKAYRRAAETVLRLDQPVEEMVAQAGRKALKDLPGIGVKMSAKIETLVRTGESTDLQEEGILLATG